MRLTLSLHQRLFLTLLAVSALIVLAMALLVHRAFDSGLERFIEARQIRDTQAISERLVERFERDGSWDRLRENRRLWLLTLFRHRPPPPRDHGDGARHGPRLERTRRLPPWLRRTLRETENSEWPPERVLRRIARDHGPTPLELRLMLFDASEQPVFGRPELLGEARQFPLKLDGERIGTLALLPGPPLHEARDLAFGEQQRKAFAIISLAAIALSALLSLPLAKRLARPIRDFRETTRRLTGGDYQARTGSAGDDELGRLGRDINTLAQTLQQTELGRRRLIADISHELRTPLALLRAQIEALQDGVRPLAEADLDLLHRDLMRLGRLVDDLHELTTTDLGALAYRKAETEPVAILSADVAAFAARFAKAGLLLSFDDGGLESITMTADEQRLSQLFRNLLRNSLAYTDVGGRVQVRVRQAQSRLLIDLEDSQPGVPEEALPRLFERLYRHDPSRSREAGGAGLGLAIAQNVVEAHEGTIQARHSALGGVWIHIELPLK